MNYLMQSKMKAQLFFFPGQAPTTVRPAAAAVSPKPPNPSESTSNKHLLQLLQQPLCQPPQQGQGDKGKPKTSNNGQT